MAWLVAVGTTVVAFIVDRGWENLDDDSWPGPFDGLDLLDGASSTVLGGYLLLGWALGRRALLASPLVLLFVAFWVLREEQSAAVDVWWIGFTLAALWALACGVRAVRRLAAVRALGRSSLTSRRIVVGPNAAASVKEVFRRRRFVLLLLTVLSCVAWIATMAMFPLERGRLFQESDGEPFSVLLAAAGLALGVLAVTEAVLFFWRFSALHAVGADLVWEVPHIRGASSPFAAHGVGCVVPVEETQQEACICRTEWERADPDDEYDLLDDDDVPASDYCPSHGIDRINQLSQREVYELVDAPWLWDGSSSLPYPIDPDSKRTLLYGFAGSPFPGIVLQKKVGIVDASSPKAEPIEMTYPVLTTSEEARNQWNQAQRPAAGVVDEIELFPAGYNGRVVRYQHGRAWFQPEEPPHQ